MQRLLILLILIATKAGTAQPVTHSKILPNGFTIYVIENHEQPQVYGAVAVRAGSKHDPKEATGIAHYLEHMLFKGTEQMGTTNFAAEKIWLDSITYYYDELGKLTDDKARLKIQLKINELSIKAGEYAIPNEVDRMLAEIGGSGVNAYTTVESTVYYNTFPSNQLEKWMEIYSHRFQKPVFRLFQSELETVYEEKNRKMDDKYMQVFDDYLKKFFKHHPYGQQTTLGETEHLKNPSLRRMYEFFNTYYVPNNMGLIICGDVNHEEVFALAEKKFGVMQRKEVPEFTFEPEAPFKGKEIIR
ncbi:MAG TPA: pitrilysin family protein, partial [Flavobacteriales bacterium]|nr:pitrilysin family protein [Flavobacteriales bacterium]